MNIIRENLGNSSALKFDGLDNVGNLSNDLQLLVSIYLVFSGSFGSSWSLEQPVRQSWVRYCKFWMLLGRCSSFWQESKSKTFSPIRYSIDFGSSSIAVPWRRISWRCSIFSTISGNFLTFEQPVRRRVRRDFNLRRLGRVLRLEHNRKFKVTSLSRDPTDSCTLVKLLQLSRLRLSRFGIIEKSGISVRYSQQLKDTSFKSLNIWGQASLVK